MNREEAIKVLSSYDVNGVWADVDGKPYNAEEQAEAFDMAIEALEGVCFDEWCDDCKEYDTEKNCCPRFNRVIRGAMKREPSEDGTLEVKVEDATKIGRVLIADDKHRGGLYYPDEDEPQGDLISRAEAIKSLNGEVAVMGKANKDEVVSYIKTIMMRIKDLPSADRPKDGDLISRADAIEALGEEPPVWCDEEYEIAERNQWRADIEAIKSVPSADRPRGEWIYSPNGIDRDFIWWVCSECGHKIFSETEKDRREFHAYCGRCGAYMRGEDE